METKVLRIVHYLNQFFGGIGGEDKAHTPPLTREGPVGPGRALQNALRERANVVATVICGDNYFAEQMERATDEVVKWISSYQPDAVIAGPAFEAGRYGLACGAVCRAVSKFGIPAVTGMYSENPGVDIYCRDAYIVQTGDSAAGMADAITRMANLALRLAAGQKIGKPSEEGYFPRGIITNELSDRTGAERVVSMLLKKLKGQPFESEVPLPKYDRIPPAPRIEDLRSATIALVTDGGFVPKGNPDRIESRGATRFGAYSFKGLSTLNPDDYEVNHIGYDPVFVRQDPNRLVPVDVMRDLEKEGKIGKLHETFYSTAGAVCIVGYVEKMGRDIASQLKEAGVSGVILTST